MSKVLPDLSWKTFSFLTVTSVVKKDNGKLYLCNCKCGNIKFILARKLLSGHVKSCGCARHRLRPELRKPGVSKDGKITPEYRIWCGIKKRCLNKNDPAWQAYGKRGIFVCHRWKTEFANFLEDMGLRPGPEYTIERENNDGPYSPTNCYWATRKQQARNRRSSLLVFYQGRSMSLAEACEISGVHYDAAKYRVSVGKPFNEEIHPAKRIALAARLKRCPAR